MTKIAIPEGAKVGLALGAGAARGWAHIGVIRHLEEQGIQIHSIAGASAGALVGGMYAAGQLSALEELVRSMDVGQVLRYFSDLTFSGSGIVDGARIIDTLDDLAGGVNIEDFRIPFAAVATDIETGEEIVFRDGHAAQAIRASISFPGVFTPVKWEGRMLVDGGLVNPVPVSVVKSLGADFCIAVDINHGRVGRTHRANKRQKRHDRFREKFGIQKDDASYKLYKKLESRFDEWKHKLSGSGQPQFMEILGDSIKIMEVKIAEYMMAQSPPDVLLKPAVGHISFLQFNRAEEAIEEGRLAAEEVF